MSDPKRLSSIWTEMPFMRGPKASERLRELSRTLADSRGSAAHRRERVLRYDWARKRLCAILGLSRAEHWNGYVPPGRIELALTQSELQDETIWNTSRNRADLIRLLRDIEEHERREVTPDGTDQVDQA